jgi:hypothetical protein
MDAFRNTMITVLVCYERISLYHTTVPFFLKEKSSRRKGNGKIFHFTQRADFCLRYDRNPVLFMERCFQHREPRDLAPDELETMKKLRDKYKTIVFFCGQGEAGNNRLDLLPFVDRLFYKSVFTDRSNYAKNLYGKNLFADYYHRNYGVTDNPEYLGGQVLFPGDARRPELSWNIGVGTYPRLHWPQRLGTVLARSGMAGLGRRIGSGTPAGTAHPTGAAHPAGTARSAGATGLSPPADFSGPRRTIPVHARIDPVSCPSIAYQRRLFLDIIGGFRGDGTFLTGMVPQKQYYRELADSKIVISPFGWGEVCFRDFEAILSGALLLKPDMSHVTTWPGVYIPYETYVPLRWDGSDILSQTEKYLDDEGERRRIAANAFDVYQKALAELPDRFDTLLGEFFP